jgi:large subunit ribosomal protein L23
MPPQLHETQVILKPLITEKATWEAETHNRYAFAVHEKANKQMIKDAIETLYQVRVKAVRTQNRHGKFRRTRWGTFQATRPKKAVVELHPEDRIDLF